MPSLYQPRTDNSVSSEHDENEPNQRHSLQPNDNAGRKRPRRNRSAPPSTITVNNQQQQSENKSSSYLHTLSRSCDNHREVHLTEDGGDMNENCQNDLQCLKKSLPKVERAYRYKVTPRGTAKGSKQKGKQPEAVEIMQLCMFYRDVLSGGFCPRAPELFQTSEGVPDVNAVLSRALFLYQGLTCPKVIAHTKLGKAAEEGEEYAIIPQADKTCHHPTHTTHVIEKTIPHFLNFLLLPTNDQFKFHPTIQLYEALIQRDLIQTLMDLAVLSEYVEEQEEGTDEEEVVQLSLFSQIGMALTRGGEPPEYLLDVVLDADVLASLQSATLNALTRWQLLRHEAKISVVKIPEAGETQASQEGDYLSTAVLELQPTQGEFLSILLSSLRPILFSPSVSPLAERTRSAALELLVVHPSVLTDMDYSTLLEASLLVVHAIGKALQRRQQWRHYADSNSLHPTTQSTDVLYNLTALLRKMVLFPPPVSGYSEADVKSMLWGTILTPLLELCLPWIQPSPNHEPGTPKTSFQKLEEMVLRTIHFSLVALQKKVLLENVDTKEVVVPLLELMKDSHLSPIAASILRALLQPIPMDVPGLCERTWDQRDSTRKAVPSLKKIPPPPPTYPAELIADDPRSPQKPSLYSPRPPAKKGKRRPSLLGDNPLTIRSPVAKRPKLVSSCPHPTEHMEDAGGGSFVEDLIQEFLLRGLDAAQTISDHIESSEEGGIKQPGKLETDASIVSGCIWLLLSLSPEDECAIPQDGVGSALLSPLFECWLSLATLIHHQASSHSDAGTGIGWTIEWQSLAAIIVNCGLHYFHVESQESLVSPSMDVSFRESCAKVCAALALVAKQMDPAMSSTPKKRACRGCCRSVLGAFSIADEHDLSLLASELCICELTTLDGTPGFAKGNGAVDGVFIVDCALITSCSLPLSIRCCLLASLGRQTKSRPPMQPHVDDAGTFALPPTWSSLQDEFSPFRILLGAKHLEWNDMTCAAMVLAPLQIVTSTLVPVGRLDEQKSHLGIVLNDFLRTVVMRAVDTIHQQDARWQEFAGKTLSVMMRQVQQLHMLLDEKRIKSHLIGKSQKRCWNLRSIEILLRPFEMGLHASDAIDLDNPSSGVYDSLRREVTFRLSNAAAAEANMNDDGTLALEDLTPPARLLRWKCLAWECLRLTTAVDLKQIRWLVRVPFSDPNEMVRDYTSREIGKVLLANTGCGMFALFSDLDAEDGEDEQSPVASLDEGAADDMIVSNEARKRQHQKAYSDRVITAVFNEVDALLAFYCDEAHSSSPTEADWEQKDGWSRRMSAARALASFCNYANTGTSLGRTIVEKSLARLVKLMVVSSELKRKERSLYTLLTPAAPFSEMERLLRPSRPRKIQDSSALLMGILACNCLLPPPSLAWVATNEGERGIEDISPAIREQRYSRLYDVVRAILVRPMGDRQLTCLSGGAADIQPFLTEVVPNALAHIIIQRDYDTIRLFAGFVKHFVKEVNKAQEKARKGREGGRKARGNLTFQRHEGYLGHSGFELRPSSLDIPARQLEDEVVLLCLGHNVLPAVLMSASQATIEYFHYRVLRDEFTLRKLITMKEQPIMRGLCSNLGDPDAVTEAIFALKSAAIALYREPQEGSALAADNSGDDPEQMTRRLVSSHFMFLVVNVVQYQWKRKSDSQKLHAVRCLNGLLDFLLPSPDAPQLFAQILATVNAANEEGSDHRVTDDWKLIDAGHVRLLAVQALSKFCHIVEQESTESLGQNLASIVVSLIPALSEKRYDIENNRRSAKAAVMLLEWLTEGELGKALAPHFKEIPFLPTSALLDNVRTNLKAHDVDFDNLLVTTQGTQSAQSKDSFSGAASIGSVDGRATVLMEGKQQAALSNRIDTVCGLLGNENVSIRRVVLEHLLNLLRANRSFFHSLVENEGSSSIGRFLTVSYKSKVAEPEGDSSFSVTKMVGTLMARCVLETDSSTKSLLGACLGEVGAIGEHRLGVISMASVLGSSDSLDQTVTAWRLSQPPWKSQLARYELTLVKHPLVVALKAAPSSADQHMIAFAIQQLLQSLDRSSCDGGSGADGETSLLQSNEKATDREMGSWLKGQLTEAEVLEVVEPFWGSQFEERDVVTQRAPPFFDSAECKSYYWWLTKWCRFMVQRSNAGHSAWKTLFHSCRTAIRPTVGLIVAEFILPLLVLDRLCFGDLRDKDCIYQEFLAVFTCNQKGGATQNAMSHPERRQALNAVFMVIETWQSWTETEKEENQQSASPKLNTGYDDNDTTWNAEDCLIQIQEVLSRLPLLLQAEAAASVGMHARALRIIEMAARERSVEQVFNYSTAQIRANALKCKRGCSMALGDLMVDGADLKLMKNVLAELNNCETMAALEENNRRAEPLERTTDSIRQNEASKNWEAALRDYERAQQLRGGERGTDPKLQWGALRCLLELGQFESVLNQVNGMARNPTDPSVPAGMPSKALLAKPFAIEAAWRLGRWETLEEMVEHEVPNTKRSGLGPDGRFQIAQGEAILGLHKKNTTLVEAALDNARQAVMESLESVARQSYSRAYPYVIRLHCLRELEDAMGSICTKDRTNSRTFKELTISASREGWRWEKRLELVSPTSSAAVINTRLALARLVKDPVLEGGLFLRVGKKARKTNLFGIAADSLSQAEAVFNGIPRCEGATEVDALMNATKMQLAKLKHDSGQSSAALKMLGQDRVHHLFGLEGCAARRNILALSTELLEANEAKLDDDAVIDRFSRRALQSTLWMVQGGLKDGGEIINRFRLIQAVAPELEKGHFHFAKYIDSAIQSRVSALMSQPQNQGHASVEEERRRADAIYRDANCQTYILTAMTSYTESLKTSSKHVYHALPRLLSLWFEITGITAPAEEKVASSSKDRRSSYGTSRRHSGSGATNLAAHLRKVQAKANAIVEEGIKQIPARAFYTAMPQLIAQIMHSNPTTANAVRVILTRVLVRYPEQAMWSLAWLCHSKNKQRKEIGEAIFSHAAAKCKEKKRGKHAALLSAAKALILHLHLVATHEAAKLNRKGTISLSPWRSDKVPLCDFIPPVQAALTAVLPSSNDAGSGKDLFPRQVPRLRDFSPNIKVMNSKAKPKRLTAFVIPAGSVAMVRTRERKVSKTPQQGDVGEIHFLVKQEAKGDLRKDARVQDLNTVINRLMASSCDSGKGGVSSNRQLRLRTFAVTCLSEYTGILEWVPNTVAMRMLVQSANNPQADKFSVRGRGSRIVDFSNVTLRSDYESECQDEFFKNGDLSLAAANFETYFLREYPPVFYWWFVKTFQDPHAWYEARTNFTLSAAAWSGVGHVIGLGDRHSENILIDTTTGECVHVDFDCIFDKGLNLPRPEIVPFRLTANMVDAFGPTGADGVYSSSLKRAMATLRDNRDTLLSVLEPFIKDPIIDWKRSRSTQSPKKSSKSRGIEMTQVQDRQAREAKHSIKVIDERLRGIYNLRNPNIRKYLKVNRNDDLTQLLPLSVEGQVHKMIAEATSSENLTQLYVGWMPWC